MPELDRSSSVDLQEASPAETQDAMLEDLLKDFLFESYESLDRFEKDLLALNENPSSQTLLTSVFRAIHTIRGTCGFFGLTNLESVAHPGEMLLIRLRDGKLAFSPEIADVLSKSAGVVRQMLGTIEREGHEIAGDNSQLIRTLTILQQEPAITPAAAAHKEPGREPEAEGSVEAMVRSNSRI